MPWCAIDDAFYSDPRVIEAGLGAAGLYSCASSDCARWLTDGLVPRRALGRMLDDGDAGPLDACLRVGLLVFRDNDDAYEVAGDLDSNQSRTKVEERKRRAKAAADKRWADERHA